jgi:peptide/nickel transport system substrate-binding protein
MKKTTILFATIIITAFLLFSCSRQKSDTDSIKAKAAELRYGLTTEPVTFDPLNPANTADGRSILFNVFEGLVKPDPSGALIPAIAESYEIESNAYIFTLRPGVLFHNGEAIKADDVVFSLNEAIKAGFPGLDKIDKIEKIAGVEITSQQKIRVSLKEPDPEYLPYLTVGIVPENNSDREKNPVGAGPFIIENYAPQQNLTLVKNPNYWQKGLPKLDKVTIVFAADTNNLLLGLRGGNIEAAEITGAFLPQLDQKQFETVQCYSNMVQLLALNNAQKPFDDERLRKALNYALDVNGIIDAAFYGHGEPSGSPLIPGLKNVYDESLRDPYPRDIEKAKDLMREAGFPNGFSLEITVPSVYIMHVDTAQVIVSQLSEAGISATIRLVDWGTWLSEVYFGRNYQATIISLDANTVSPRSFLFRYVSGDNGNFINFKNPEYDRVYKAALLEPDEIKRIALYKECQRIISESAASVFIQDILGFRVFAADRFGGVVNYPLYVIDFASMYRK